jgi:hypothetical protein
VTHTDLVLGAGGDMTHRVSGSASHSTREHLRLCSSDECSK